MSASKTHLGTETLTTEAAIVAEEIAEHLEKVDVTGMRRAGAPNFYYYKSPALFELVRRLVKELPFIKQKVILLIIYFAQ
jgi:hypothetical protein